MNGMYGYGNGYGYAPPYTPQMGTGAQMPQRCQAIKVNGRNGADAFHYREISACGLLPHVRRTYCRTLNRLVYRLCIFCTSLFSLTPLDIRRK